MHDPVQDMIIAQTMIRQTITDLKSQGIEDLAIASVLFNAAGVIWRREFPDVTDRRKVVSHAAEIAITGKIGPGF